VAVFPAGSEPTRHGVVSCVPLESAGFGGPTAEVALTPFRGGAPVRRIPVNDPSGCTAVRLSGGWLVEADAAVGDEEPYTLTALDTGERRRVTVPRRHTPVSFAPYPLAPTERMVVTRETGEPTVLLAHGTSVLRVATEP